MFRATPLSVAFVRLLRPFIRRRIHSRDFTPPRRALILKPCCLSQVMLTTPLLGVLADAYPQATFDWAVGDWSRSAVITNPHLNQPISTGNVGLPQATRHDLRRFAHTLRAQEYDTCFIPSRSTTLSLVAWWAGIPQRVGLDFNGRGVAHTIGVQPQHTHTAEIYLGLARAIGLDTAAARVEFHPTDAQRNAVMERLIETFAWRGDRPLIVLHPGGGVNPTRRQEEKRWPIERFALLGNHIVRRYDAHILIVGGRTDTEVAVATAGLMSAPAVNLCGRLSLGELGALAELAAVYVGNDSGPSHVAAAVGCPTLIIYGPQENSFARPRSSERKLTALWRPYEGPFSWDKGVTVADAVTAVDRLLTENRLILGLNPNRP